MVDPLLDKGFLLKLDQMRHKVVFAKITSLSFEGDPIAEITGNISGGSINIDGASAVRRTCNLTIVTKNIAVNDIDWALRTKFKLAIGLENTIDNQYDDIIWFPQGEFILTNFSSSLNTQGFTINVTGKDKMCLLNGDVGGALFATHDFGTIYQYQKDGTIKKEKIPIYDIIREAIHVYAQEPYSKIFINDLDTCGVELLDFVGHKVIMYVYQQKGNAGIWDDQIAFSGTIQGDFLEQIYEQYGEGGEIDGTRLVKRVNPDVDPNVTVGYRAVNLTYNDDLIVELGGTITSMLDKIVKMLGEFEYFYDVNGNFIFQRKKIYFNASWTNAITNENQTYYDSVANSSSNVYNFLQGYLVESFSNKPQLNAIKNDYAVWGKRVAASGVEMPIHLRYAIDIKPQMYYSYTEKKLYVSNLYEFITNNGKKLVGQYDWRELIYQMAKDNLNKTKVDDSDIYELLTDEEREWYDSLRKTLLEEQSFNTGYDAYYADMLAFWPQLYRTTNKVEYVYNDDGTVVVDADGVPELAENVLSTEEWEKWQDNGYWNPDLIKYDEETGDITFINPELLTFWIDFLDKNEDSALYKYSVPVIGRRSKTVNDDQVKAIYFRDTPNLLFVNDDYEPVAGEENLAYVRINIVPPYSNYLRISAQGKSAKEVLDSMVYDGTYYQDSISFSCIPVYYLEPNTRINIHDDTTGIDGEYLIKSFSIPLSHDGMMSVNATRAAARII